MNQKIIIDVRTPAEYADGHLEGALHIDFLDASFKSEVMKLDKTNHYLLYCRSGNRSGQGTEMMKQLGFTQVENIGTLQQAAELTHCPIVTY